MVLRPKFASSGHDLAILVSISHSSSVCSWSWSGTARFSYERLHTDNQNNGTPNFQKLSTTTNFPKESHYVKFSEL